MKKVMKKVFTVLLAAFIVVGLAMPQTAEAASTRTATFDQTEARSMLEYVNDFRTGSDAWAWDSQNQNKIYYSDLGTLVIDPDLEKIAMTRALELTESYSHTRPNGTSCFTATSNGVSSYGENIAYGYNMMSQAKEAYMAWREDDYGYSGQGHRRAMLGKNYTAVGIACVRRGTMTYWVQEFGYASGQTLEDPVDGYVNATIATEAGEETTYTVKNIDGSYAIDIDDTLSVGENFYSTIYVGSGCITVQYQVTSKNANGGTLKQRSMYCQNVKDALIPDAIYINGKQYKVTVAEWHCINYDKNYPQKVKTLTIGKNIKTIEYEAFANLKGLKTVTFRGTKLKSVGSNAFQNSYSKVTFNIPSSVYTKYKKLLTGKGQSAKAVYTKY